MSKGSKMHDKRRSERVLLRIPVQIRGVAEDGSAVTESAQTVVVSRFGALLRVASRLKLASPLSITHGLSQQAEEFKVVWISDKQDEGRWDIGVEAATTVEEFWGVRFPTAPTRA